MIIMRGRARDAIGKYVVHSKTGLIGVVLEIDGVWFVTVRVRWLHDHSISSPWIEPRNLRFASPLEVLATAVD